MLQSDAGAPDKKVLSRGRISTKSGEILILEEDGSVTGLNLDSPEGKDAFAVTEADLMALNANLGWTCRDARHGAGEAAPAHRTGKGAGRIRRARTQPMRLNLPASFKAAPKDFRAPKSKASTSRRKAAAPLSKCRRTCGAGGRGHGLRLCHMRAGQLGRRQRGRPMPATSAP